jgi:CheY-like chemotaxis protein
MPEMSGFEVASRLRQNPRKYGSALLVALTGRTGDNRDRRIAKEIGFDDYLVKPANPEQLRRVVSASLDREEG